MYQFKHKIFVHFTIKDINKLEDIVDIMKITKSFYAGNVYRSK